MQQRYTRGEVKRIVGLDQRQLNYWERLRLVRPTIRWRERFYTFSDLVALETIKRLTAKRVPASRLRRAISALEAQLGGAPLSLEKLCIISNGREVAVLPPDGKGQAFEPLTGQLLLRFDVEPLARKVHKMASRTAEGWYELALSCDARPGGHAEAVTAYQRVIKLEPQWVEARINLGVALYHLGRLDEAAGQFTAVIELEPRNSVAYFNLGCVFDADDYVEEAVEQFRIAIRLTPDHSDAHYNLAVALEKLEKPKQAREHWAAYLRYAPGGQWADYARARLAEQLRPKKRSAPIPFRKRK